MEDIILEPEFKAFKEKYEKNISQVVSFKFSNNEKTITSSFLKTSKKNKNSFLFESLEDGDTNGRFSIIGLNPDLVFKVIDNQSIIEENGNEISREYDRVNESIKKFIKDSHLEIPENIPSVAAGVYGYIGYDFVRNIEILPNQNKDALGIPDIVLLRPSVTIVFDNISKEISIFSCSRPKENQTADENYKNIEKNIKETFISLNNESIEEKKYSKQKNIENPKSNTSKDEYFEMVKKAREYIIAGDIFQVVPSQRFFTPFKISPFKLYESLRKINPSPYMYYLDLEDFYIVGSSPETLVKTENNKITIKPIAGTRLKKKYPNRELEKELLSDPKERAEHLMLLDLGRNDVGKVSKIAIATVGSAYTSAPAITIAAPATETVDASDAAVCVVADDEIVVASAFYGCIATGDVVTYADGGGTAAVGLTTATGYYLIKSGTSNRVGLATTKDRAIAGTNIVITAVGVGSSHTLIGQTPTATATLGMGTPGVTVGESEGFHIGWVKKTIGTGGRAGRVFYETLVAASSITGDSEDLATPDS